MNYGGGCLLSAHSNNTQVPTSHATTVSKTNIVLLSAHSSKAQVPTSHATNSLQDQNCSEFLSYLVSVMSMPLLDTFAFFRTF